VVHALRQPHDPPARQRRLPAAAKHQAAADLSAAARDSALRIPIDEPLPLDRIAEAHERVDAGTRNRVVLSIPQ
jgi:NADPH2:quinone reductase